MNRDRIRVGMIGVGSIAQGHIQNLLASHHAEIVALCDPSEESINKTLERNDDLVEEVEQFQDYRDLLAGAKPDAVVICSRHADHFAQIMDSMDAGAHVLTEKPLVNTTTDAYAVLKKQRETGKIVGIAYQRHTTPHFRYIRDAIASGEYGPVQAVAVLQQQGWKRGTIGSWRQDPALSGGGQLHDSGSHLIDILLWTTGLTAKSVAAVIDNRGAKVDINSALAVRFVENAVGTVTVIGDSMGWHEDMTIWCDRGTFYVRSDTGLRVQRPDGRLFTPAEADMAGSANIDDNFIAAIRGEAEIAAPTVCGLRAIELTEAAWKSAAQQGLPVEVEHAEE